MWGGGFSPAGSDAPGEALRHDGRAGLPSRRPSGYNRSFASAPGGAPRLTRGLHRTDPMLYYLIATIYILSCLVLLMVVLLQQGKGGDIASAFGGSSSQT